jgi:GNAT superfamily N-acetyltransferase
VVGNRQLLESGRKVNEMTVTVVRAVETELITIRPVGPREVDRMALRCLPDRGTIDCLFAQQGTIGMAAWEGDKCVGQLHCYHVALPSGTNYNWPDNGANWWSGRKARAEWRNWGPGMEGLELKGAAWCHGCFHVGRTMEAFRAETRKLVVDLAEKNRWDPVEVLSRLKRTHAGQVTFAEVKDIMKEALSSERGEATQGYVEEGYIGRGIGTALCRASIQWARYHGYAAVLAPGGPAGMFEFAKWTGHLPWTTYAKMGFKPIDDGWDGELPSWARGDAPAEVMAEVRDALTAGRAPHELRERLMILDLKRA